MTIGDLCNAGNALIQTGPFGSQLHQSDYVANGVRVVATECIGHRRLLLESAPHVSAETALRLSRHKLRANDILFARRGAQATGYSAIVEGHEGELLCSTGAILLRLTGSVADPRFFSFLLAAQDSIDWFKQHSVGAVMPNLNETVLRAFPFELPLLDEQRAMAQVLAALDDKIELNRRMNRTLEELSAALFRSWFVDFDPVVAKAAGRKPAHLRPDLAALFPAHFQDSPLGPIPQGWRVGNVDEIMEVVMGQSPPGSSYNEVGDGAPFFQGCTDFGFRFPSNRIFCTAPTRFAKKGDILLSVRAPVGDTNIALEDCTIGRGLAALRGRNGEKSFPLYALRSFTEEFASYEGEGTLFGAINGPALRGLRLVIPPAPLLEAFEKCAVPWDSMIEHNERESRTLAALRDTLLPKLLSGELRVKSAEKLVEAKV